MNKTSPTPRRLITCNKMMDKIDLVLDGRADHRLEDAAKMPKNKINKIRTGKQYMRADEIWRISLILKVPVAWLLNDVAKLEEQRASLDADAAWNLGDHTDKGANGSNKAPLGKTEHSPRRK